jgi:hypothetical protein
MHQSFREGFEKTAVDPTVFAKSVKKVQQAKRQLRHSVEKQMAEVKMPGVHMEPAVQSLSPLPANVSPEQVLDAAQHTSRAPVATAAQHTSRAPVATAAQHTSRAPVATAAAAEPGHFQKHWGKYTAGGVGAAAIGGGAYAYNRHKKAS